MTAFAPLVKKATAKFADREKSQEFPKGQQRQTAARDTSSRRLAPPGLLYLPIHAPGTRSLQQGMIATHRASSFAKRDSANGAEEPTTTTSTPATTAAAPTPQQSPEQAPQQTPAQTGGDQQSGTVPDVRTPPGGGRSTEPELTPGAGTPKADALMAETLTSQPVPSSARFPVSVNFHLRGHQPRVDRPSGGKEDPAVSGVAMGTFSQPGGRAVDPFGSEFYEPAFTGISYAFAGGKCTISGNLDTICPWGTNNGGDIDVPSATAPVVTADKWQAIHDDLKPGSTSPFKSPRNKYYSQALVERHEKFHGTDDLAWTTSTGIGFVKSTIEAGSVASASAAADVATLVDKARTKLIAENLKFYKGGGADHDSYAGEIRAYADGRPEYQKLADAVEVQGKKLATPPAPSAPGPTPPSPAPAHP